MPLLFRSFSKDSPKAKTYTTPDQIKLAPYAGFWRRFAGSLIDWIICFFAPVFIFTWSFARGGNGAGGNSAIGWLLTAVIIGIVVGYFTYFWSRGRSVGMMAMGIQIINARTGKPPGVGRAFARSLLALILAASTFILFDIGFSDRPAGFAATDLAIIYFLVFVFAISVLGKLWMIWDAQKQTLQDKLTGVVIVGKMTPVDQESSMHQYGREPPGEKTTQ